MNRLFPLLTIALLCLIPVAAEEPAPKPNVIFIITDDQGYGDLSCHGNPILETPYLDQLASESIRLDDYHVSPTCTPTRAALLTGHWTNRTGAWHTIIGRSLLRENEVTLAQIFKDNGYATGMFGKWHLGDNYPFRASDRGFDEVLCHGGGGVGQTPDYWDNAYFDGTYFHNNTPVAVEGYCTDVFFDHAKEFIAQKIAENEPYFAYISTNAPHGPFHSPEEYITPAYQKQSTKTAHFFGMIANIDENVGKLRQWLHEQGEDHNTIFIFTTDNGTAAGDRIFNSGMKGKKGSAYDGGHRVPFFLHWPAGGFGDEQIIDTLTAHVDIVPTLIDLAQIQSPEGLTFDGRSLRPLFENEEAVAEWPDRILITDSQRVKDPIKWKSACVMTEQWRLVTSYSGKLDSRELYDINADPGQENNVAADHPEVMDRLTAFYDAWWDELEPTFSEPARIKIGHPAENPSRLTSHDWIAGGKSPWNQQQIRQGKPATGFWNVEVVEAGDYEIELRRWPNEGAVGAKALRDGIPAGAPVPGTEAFRVTPGTSIPIVSARIKIGSVEQTVSVSPSITHATFTVSLEPGPAQFSAAFEAEDGTRYGAFYAYVKKL